MKDIKVILVSANYPNTYYLWTPWNKMANLAISKIGHVETEVVAPLPFSLPIKYFPYNKLSNIPKMENGEEGSVYRPRFLYLLPKNLFYNVMGEFYRTSISSFMFENLKKPDLIHSHQAYPDGYGMIDLCEKWSVPLVIDIHSTDSLATWLNHGSVHKKFMKTLNYASKIICISNSLADMVWELGIESEKIESIPMGVDIDKFKPRNREEISRRFGIKDEVVILFVGLLIDRKGVNYLLKAIQDVKESSKINFKVLIVGDGAEKSKLLKLSKELGIERVVSFIGELRGEDLLNIYSLADLFVLPSLAEGKPIVIYEAMASECAIIATNVDGIPEQVKEGYNGLLVEPRDPSALADKIKYLLNNEELMKKMGKYSRKRVIDKKWTWDGYAKKVTNLYNDITH